MTKLFLKELIKQIPHLHLRIHVSPGVISVMRDDVCVSHCKFDATVPGVAHGVSHERQQAAFSATHTALKDAISAAMGAAG